MTRFACCAILLVAVCAVAADFPEPYNSEKNPAIPLMPATQAAASIKVPDGFHVDLFASEPDVQNPIGMCWDSRGRMWVAENYTYAEGAKHFDLSLRDRVLILEDKDHDGHAETRTVFTDNVQMLTSVEVGRGGVWLMTPPQLLFIPMRDGEDKPAGPPLVVLDGFTVSQANYHNFANGLRWGPDGWLYGRCGHSCPGRIGLPGTPDAQRIPLKGGIWRFHPEKKIFEVLCHGTTNPWGYDWDKDGELFFINTVNGFLWHMMPGAHFKESSGESTNPLIYERLDQIADHYHYDTKAGWKESQNLRGNDKGGGHAHVGMMIYQADQWPAEYRNKLYTMNLHGRRTNVERLERLGAGYVGRHDQDIFQSGDPWFRGMEISTGPDGSAYILDWSDTGDCHDHAGVHRQSGRIFKVSYGKPRESKPAIYPRCMMGSGKLPELWKQYQAGQTTPAQLRALLSDPDEHVRVWAIRLLTDFWPLDTLMGPQKGVTYPDDPESRAAFVRMAKEDPSGLVRLVLASVLQRLPLEQRAELAIALVHHEEDASDHNLPDLVWYGIGSLGESHPDALVSIAKQCRWPTTLRFITHSLAAQIEKNPEPIDQLLLAINALPAARLNEQIRINVLSGLTEAFRGWRKAPRPKAFDAFERTLPTDLITSDIRELEILFGDGRALDDIRKIALDAKASPGTRAAAFKSLIDARPPDLRQVCEKLLDQKSLVGQAIRGLAQFDDPAIADRLVRDYKKFSPADRAAAIDVLASRPAFAKVLLENLGGGKPIAAADLTPFQARQIRNLNDEAISAKLAEKWGALNETDADKKQLIAKLKSKLTPEVLAKADLSRGRQLFTQTCAVCHTLYGEGGKVGPDLTGSGRGNLDYVLENVVDPSAIVAADYRMEIVTMKDGRVLNGIVTQQNARTLTIREPAQESTLEKAEILRQKTSPISLMPEGLLQTMPDEQVRDLVGYFMSPKQVPLPEDAGGKK
jgi:putative membrane-bound dehydrogenase-like protein